MKTIKIGKNATNDVVINDETVSRAHALLTVKDTGEVTIKDLNSTNGTFVDGVRVTEEVQLSGSQVVRLGNHVIDWQSLIKSDNKTAVHPRGQNIFTPTDSVEKKTIGRSDDNDIRIAQSDISGHHAILCRKQNGEVAIVDCNSTNGTFVNGQRITGERVLNAGDIVVLAQNYPLQWQTIFALKPSTPNPIAGTKSSSSLSKVLISFITVAVIAAISCWIYFNREMKPAEIYSMYKNSVVLICNQRGYSVTLDGKPIGSFWDDLAVYNNCFVDDESNIRKGIRTGYGTGFFISQDGRIMTNKHVVDYMGKSHENDAETIKGSILNQISTLYQQASNRQEREFLSKFWQYVRDNLQVSEVVSTSFALNDTHVNSNSDFTGCAILKESDNDNLDVAILQVNSKRTPDCVNVLVNIEEMAQDKDLEIGDKVCTIGFPQAFDLGATKAGLEANNQSGEITQERGEFTYGHNMKIDHGASGSPVFDCHGRFAGIIVSGFFLGETPLGYNMAIRPDKAANFAKQ